jgi:hypothetical protein
MSYSGSVMLVGRIPKGPRYGCRGSRSSRGAGFRRRYSLRTRKNNDGNESAMGAVGSWTMKMQTPGGEQEAEVALNEDGTGSMKSMMGELELADVVYEGNDVSFTAAMGPISMEFAGTADGDSFTGTAKSPMGESPVTGVRA